MIGGTAGEFRNTGSAAASSAWACLLHFVLVLARVLIGAVGLIPIGKGFSATPQCWLVPTRPSVRSWRCVCRTRAGPIPCCQFMASEKSTHSSHSFQVPPRGAASCFLCCFHSAAWLPARSSFRPKARLLRRFHRAGQQPTPRGTASGAQLPPPRSARLNGAQPLPVSESIRRAAHHWHCRIPLVPRRPAPVRANPRPGPACVTAPIPPPTWRQ